MMKTSYQSSSAEGSSSSSSRASSGNAFTNYAARCLNSLEPRLRIFINREEPVLAQAMGAYKDPSLDLRRKLFVKFRNEQGQDNVGPTREFFDLLYSAILCHENSVHLVEGRHISCRMFRQNVLSLFIALRRPR